MNRSENGARQISDDLPEEQRGDPGSALNIFDTVRPVLYTFDGQFLPMFAVREHSKSLKPGFRYRIFAKMNSRQRARQDRNISACSTEQSGSLYAIAIVFWMPEPSVDTHYGSCKEFRGNAICPSKLPRYVCNGSIFRKKLSHLIQHVTQCWLVGRRFQSIDRLEWIKVDWINNLGNLSGITDQDTRVQCKFVRMRNFNTLLKPA